MPRLAIKQLRQAYLEGTLTPAEVVNQCLARIAASPQSNAWIHVLTPEQLEPYLQALSGMCIDTCPLWGIPFAIKDNIDLAGVPTTAGCPDFARVPECHATVVERLIAAGGIPLGKTNLDQFATGLVGTRSPYGEVPNVFLPEYISGGSSSGSAWAVANGEACFALGTDTAGSGRVPAAFNHLVGCKPTRGRLSTRGVVPACRSLDCVSVFTDTLDDAEQILALASGHDPLDAWSRPPLPGRGWVSARMTIGVPRKSQLEFFGNDEYARLFRDACEELERAGARLVEIDFEPFLAAARLLYQGAWVAERYAAVGGFIAGHQEAVLPVIRDIITPAASLSAVDAFTGIYALQALRLQADAVMKTVDAVVTPTAGTCYRREEIAADPLALNSNLGRYTNFMNLLDYAALAVPAGSTRAGLPFGITLFGPAFSDERLFAIVRRIQEGGVSSAAPTTGYITVAVCGAHLSGMPLNGQLTQRDAVLVERVLSAPHYRFYALAGGPPYRPGMVRVSEGGVSVAMELWAVPEAHFGSFVAGIPAPLGIGKVETAEGRWVSGFICEAIGMAGARDISAFGDWRAYMASLE